MTLICFKKHTFLKSPVSFRKIWLKVDMKAKKIAILHTQCARLRIFRQIDFGVFLTSKSFSSLILHFLIVNILSKVVCQSNVNIFSFFLSYLKVRRIIFPIDARGNWSFLHTRFSVKRVIIDTAPIKRIIFIFRSRHMQPIVHWRVPIVSLSFAPKINSVQLKFIWHHCQRM